MRATSFLILAVLGTWGVLHAQRAFKEYRGIEYENFPLPPDWNSKTEWTRARCAFQESIAAFTAASTGPWITRARTVICCKGFDG